MRIKVIRLFFLLCIWMLTGLGVNAQSMYPAFPSSIYYNVDTTAIKLGKELVLKKSYTTEELARVFDGSWDPDSAVLATPYEEAPCTMVGRLQRRRDVQQTIIGGEQRKGGKKTW